MAAKPIDDEVIKDRLRQMKPSVLAALLRCGRRIEQGFEGQIIITVKMGGVQSLTWTQTETGDVIREELG